MGWPLRQLPRRVYIAHVDGVACAVGAGGGKSLGRAPKTRRMLLRAMIEAVAAGQRVREFRSVSVGVWDAHCSEVMAGYAEAYACLPSTPNP